MRVSIFNQLIIMLNEVTTGNEMNIRNSVIYCLTIKSLIDKMVSWLFLEFKDKTKKCT